MTRLLDINVLLAMAWPKHPNHAQVHAWLKAVKKENGKIGIATCPITELGFCRISMRLPDGAADLESAGTVLSYLLDRKEYSHTFITDDLAFPSWALQRPDAPDAAQLTDIYLASLAERHGAKLLTMDQGITGPTVELIS